ncbi:Acetolactate synthase isozyme 3 large subunit [Serratia liquefaciens]|uniref:thiamine pyrophosphate-binding protein n=1 Tax=Serratia liquefaciens TaxID=614 RepID=UPI002183C604|nr:thiamine pyrophosphate-binding protein [Serratia liquefaciens]CAI2408142.1 Acetolactate synthase isozyme 3 large subunit [Serratia liquefaciens]
MESHAEKLYTPVALATADGVRVIATPGAKAATQSNADAIIQSLEARGIQHIFLVPGKLVYPLIKSIEHSGIAGIVGAHETACGFMADGYARASRKFGVCLGISGPGTMNFLPAMAAAQADKIPVLYLAGGIATYHEAQGAFQDGSNSGIDELTIVKPLLSAAIEVKNNLTLQHELRRSLSCLNTQRKGRTYLSVPVDMQKKEVAGGHEVSPPRTPQCREAAIDPQALDQVLDDYLLRGLNVACLVGNRMNNPLDAALLLRLAEKYRLPVATTLSGKGAFPEGHELALGLYGFAGHIRAVETINGDEVDVLLVLGCDLSQRDSLNWNPRLHGTKTLVVIDEDFDKVSSHYQPDMQIFSSLTGSLHHLLDAVSDDDAHLNSIKRLRNGWLEQVSQLPLEQQRPDLQVRLAEGEANMYPGDAIKRIRSRMNQHTNVVVDSGAHRIFMAHHWQASGRGDYHTSSSLAPMGWAICAGIGIKLAAPHRDCVVVTGDGCMLMHGIEIQTAARYQVKMTFVVMNNCAHGAMHIDTLQNRGVSADYTALPNHDWKAFANSLGVASAKAATLEELDEALTAAAEHEGPFLIEVLVGNHVAPNRYYAESIVEYEQRIKGL